MRQRPIQVSKMRPARIFRANWRDFLSEKYNKRLTRPNAPAFRSGFLLGGSLLALVACAPQDPPMMQATRAMPMTLELPPVKLFSATPQLATPVLANANLTRDFIELSFQLESGRPLPFFTRFDGPITVYAAPSLNQIGQRDLQQLLARFRSEAGLSITLSRSSDARIVIEAIPRARIQSTVSGAACFVVPNVRGWAEFQKAKNSGRLDWTTLRSRTTATVFVPSDAPPQEVRDCLHEELAQGLGPLNDLFRLENSVFNDDNFHSVLTPYDMLMLRAYYHPSLANGMTRDDVATRLPAIFAQLNPAGAALRPTPIIGGNSAWEAAINASMTGSLSFSRRTNASENAVRLANSTTLPAQSRAFSLFALGQLKLRSDPGVAYGAFRAADGIYSQQQSTAIQSAHVKVQLAGFALSAGDATTTLRLTDEAIPVAYAHQNAAILASLMMLRAEALDLLGRPQEAAEQRLDSLGWARYGFGSDDTVRRKLAEISALNPAI